MTIALRPPQSVRTMDDMKRTTPILDRNVAIWLVALVGLCAGYFLGVMFGAREVVVRENTPDNPAAESSVNLMIVEPGGIVRAWNTVTWHESQSVHELLGEVAAVGAITYLSKNGTRGLEISSINGAIASPDDGLAWRYWVNGQEPPRTPDKYNLRPGDMVVVALAKQAAE